MNKHDFLNGLLSENDHSRTDNEVKKMLEYLAWRGRASGFSGDFKKSVIDFLMKEKNIDKPLALVNANTLWDSYKKRGMVETYQEYISSDDMTDAFCHAINNA